MKEPQKYDLLDEYHRKMCEFMSLQTDLLWPNAVDPNKEVLDAPNHQFGDFGSNAMNERKNSEIELDPSDEEMLSKTELSSLFDQDFDDLDDLDFDDDGDEDYVYEDEYTVTDFLSRLEAFLVGELDEASRGNVFMSKNGDKVALNILVGAPFANSDEDINQINVIISPTDRSLLGSTGVSMDDREYEDEDEDMTTNDAFDSAMSFL